MFDEERAEFAGDREQLHAVLDEAAYDAARRTTINAHYTDAGYVREIWRTVQELGFDGGEVLEPGCGSGTFIGLAPLSARMTGVELDPTTAAIAAHIYPDATIRAESFAETRYPRGHFDVTIGNVPFADVRLHDPGHNPNGRLAMHNHFIAKGLDLTRPGGLVAVLTSHYTLDSTNPEARRLFSQRADLVGAVRLPTGAHRRAAGTDALTDLLILRVREPGTEPRDTAWEDTVEVELPGPNGPETARINRHFVEHPERVLGEMRVAIGMYGVAGLEVTGVRDATEQLREALRSLEAQARADGLVMTPATAHPDRPAARSVALDDEIDGHIVARPDGSFQVRREGMYEDLRVPKTQADELRALLGLRDQARELVSEEASRLDDTDQLSRRRTKLAGDWQAYVDQYGPINRFTDRPTGRVDDNGDPTFARITPPAVRLLTREDPYGPLVAALESFDPQTQTARPAGLLRGRQIVPRQPVLGTDDPIEALEVTLDTHGIVDLDHIADLLGIVPDQAQAQLGDAIYELPATTTTADPVFVPRAEYLSGNVREKLDAALAAAEDDPQWMRNVHALRAVIPADLGPGDIQPRLGAVWIPAEDHQQFLRDILDDRRATVTHYGGSRWQIEANKHSIQAVNEWGTQRVPAPELISKLMSQDRIIVMDTVGEDSDKRQVLNPTETQAAQDKAQQLQERFAAWVWEDEPRTERLLADYNRRFNAVVLRDYTVEGERLSLPGLAKNFTPRPHQRAAVARMLNEQSVGLFHQVGAGKTAEMVIGTTELRRLGMVTKPAVVVPNHMLEQISREWLQLYPQARILAASSDDLARDKRRQFVARAATNDWDAVILTRTAFQSLNLSPDHQAAYIDRQVAELRRQLEAANERGDRPGRTLKAMEKALARDEERIKSQLAAPRDPGITFEATGIDYLVVDEMHEYKNLRVVSNINGASIAGSQRSRDLDMKLDYLRQTHGNRVLTSATATPIANSVTEMYVMQRYHNPAALESAGITDFDSWAATFGEVVTSMEINVVGDTFKPKDRFAKFTNVPELLAMFHQFGDIKTAEDLKLPTPDLAPRPDGQRLPEVLRVPTSPALAAYIGELSERVDQIAGGGVDPTEDNMLKVSSDGRKAALDLRLVTDPASWDTLNVPQTKVDAAADRIARIWAENADNTYLDPDTGETSPIPGALQIVFCDLSTPNPDGRWNVYDALRAGLYERGLPQGSVRFIHEANNDTEKARLFAECRTGRVSVIIGSTSKMGVGTNIQARAVHLVDMDAPWRPADVEQRHGRILRQGNQNPEIQLSQAITEGSFDTYMWQTLERKSKFINQIMRGDVGGREIEDIGGDTLSFTEFKAIASNNPLLLEEAQSQADLKRWQARYTSHQRNQNSLASRIRNEEQFIAHAHTDLPLYRAAADRSIDTLGDRFAMTIQGRRYTKRPDAEAALHGQLTTIRRVWPGQAADLGVIATVGGHDITAHQDQDSLYLALADIPEIRSIIAVRDLTKAEFVPRCENLTKGIDKRIRSLELKLEEAQHRLTQAKNSYGKPFKHTDELAAAQRRHAEVTQRMHDQQKAAQEAKAANPLKTPTPPTVTIGAIPNWAATSSPGRSIGHSR